MKPVLFLRTGVNIMMCLDVLECKSDSDEVVSLESCATDKTTVDIRASEKLFCI